MRSDFLRMTTAFFLAGAMAGTGHAAPVEVSETEVKHCRLLAKVTGTSGFGKKLSWRPAARASAIRKAEASGASHVVFTGTRPVGAFNGVAKAEAFACP